MATVRIELDPKGIEALLKSDEVQDELERRGERIAAAAGPGHEVDVWIGFDRAHVTVRTATREAAVREARDHTLLRALDAGRG